MPATKITRTSPDEPQPQQGGEVVRELENGPMAKRVCRDVLCCLLFIAFIIGMIGIGAYGYTKGKPSIIGRGYDSNGNMCGVTAGYESHKYLYFPIPFTGHLDTTVCLKSCPSGDSTTLPSLLNLVPGDKNANPSPSSYTGGSMVSDYYLSTSTSQATKFYIYATTGYVSRYCLPTVDGTNALSYVLSSNGSDALEQWISDIQQTWPVIAVSIGVAFIIGFVYMVFLRYFSGILTWLAILTFIAGTAILGWRFYQQGKKSEESITASGDTGTTTYNSEKIIAYVCWGVAIFTVLAVLCLWSRIRLAIAILKAAADYVKDTPSVFLVPIFTVVILLVFYAFWSGAMVFLVSSGEASKLAGSPFATFTFDKTLKRLMIYQLFGLLWVNAFIIAATQFVMASSTALWYFSQGTGQNTPGTIRTSVKRLFRYHFGSIAFGSLILAIVQFIRLVLAYMEAQAKKMQGKNNKVVIYTLKCLQCYVGCFERFIKFLNKNAYIQIALTGKGFCGAAKDAFMLILNNPLRMGVVSSIGSVFVLFGKIFVASLTALAAFLVITNWDTYSEQIYSPFIPTLVVFIFAYAVGAVFMTVYGLAADTILACFIVDEQINKKKNAPPRHCPESLRDFLDKHGKN